VRLLPPLALALAALAGPALGGDGLEFQGALRLRASALHDLPGTVVRWDPSATELTSADYLRTAGRQESLSGLASLGLTGRHLGGDLRWALTADTGELRSERPHRLTSLCWSRTAPSGLAIPGSGDCSLYPLTRVIVPAEETGRGAAELTSNGRPLGEEARRTWFVREAYAAYDMGRAGFLTATAGRKRTTVGDGYVYDDYATGVELRADLGAVGPQWDLSAALFQPTRDLPRTVEGISPVLALRADYLPSLFDHAGLFAALLRERTGSFANVFRGAIEERLVLAASQHDPGTAAHRLANQLLAATAGAPYDSETSLGWLGTSGTLTPRKGHRLGWTAAVLRGDLHRVKAGGAGLILADGVQLRGQLASLRWDGDLGRGLSGGASLLYLSGGEMPRATLDEAGEVTPATGTYRGFVGIAPYLTETNLFFGGGLSESFADRQASAPGVNGRGVIAPVVQLRLAPADGASLLARAAWLGAPVRGPFGGRTYGTELDLEASWEVARWLVLGAELDALFPGDFFRGRDPILKGVLAVDLVTP
jgi:hypothetical protein